MSFERRGLLPWRLLSRGTGSWKWKNGTLQCSQPYNTYPFSAFIAFSIFGSLCLSLSPLSPEVKRHALFGAKATKPLEEIVWFWNYPSALNKVGKPSFQNSKHHLRPKLSNFNLVLTQKWTIAPYSQKVTINHSVIFQLRGLEMSWMVHWNISYARVHKSRSTYNYPANSGFPVRKLRYKAFLSLLSIASELEKPLLTG